MLVFHIHPVNMSNVQQYSHSKESASVYYAKQNQLHIIRFTAQMQRLL